MSMYGEVCIKRSISGFTKVVKIESLIIDHPQILYMSDKANLYYSKYKTLVSNNDIYSFSDSHPIVKNFNYNIWGCHAKNLFIEDGYVYINDIIHIIMPSVSPTPRSSKQSEIIIDNSNLSETSISVDLLIIIIVLLIIVSLIIHLLLVAYCCQKKI